MVENEESLIARARDRVVRFEEEPDPMGAMDRWLEEQGVDGEAIVAESIAYAGATASAPSALFDVSIAYSAGIWVGLMVAELKREEQGGV